MINEFPKDSVGIRYKSGDLFKGSSKGSILVHSVNCCGVWGSGVAKTFKELFPKSFNEYECYSSRTNSQDLLGSSFICSKENDFYVGCLFASKGFGKTLDPKESILENTEKAFRELLSNLNTEVYKDITTIAMPKINSGLFRTPWEETEEVLLKVLTEFKEKLNFTIEVNVWSL